MTSCSSCFPEMISNHSSTVSFTAWLASAKAEICSEAVARKQESTQPCGLWPVPWAVRMPWRSCAQVWGWGQCYSRMFHSWQPRAGESRVAIIVAKSPWKWRKGPGHSRDTVTCLIPLFYFRDERWSCEPRLHSGFNIQFVLSMVYCWSFTQSSPPAGFVCCVDESEFDTAKFEPEIISYVTIHGSNQMHATSLQWIRVEAVLLLGCPGAMSLMVQLPKSNPHHLSLDAQSLFKQVVCSFHTLGRLCLKSPVKNVAYLMVESPVVHTLMSTIPSKEARRN